MAEFTNKRPPMGNGHLLELEIQHPGKPLREYIEIQRSPQTRSRKYRMEEEEEVLVVVK